MPKVNVTVQRITADLAQELWTIHESVHALPAPNFTTKTGSPLRRKEVIINGLKYMAYEGNQAKANIDARDTYFYPVDRSISENYYVKIRDENWYVGSWTK